MKDFKNNPALQFISGSTDEAPKEPETAPQETTTPKETKEPPKPRQRKKKDLDPERLKELQELIPAGFKIDGIEIPAGYKLVRAEEKRTKRLQLVVAPSWHERARAAAEEEGISLNSLVIKAVYEYMERKERSK